MLQTFISYLILYKNLFYYNNDKYYYFFLTK